MASSMVTLGGAVSLSLLLLYLVKKYLKKKKYSVVDQVVLITGASSGLGEACAHAFYKAGAKVILSARRLKELERVKEELMRSRQGHEPQILSLDLADTGALQSKAKEALSFHGRVDILINNGGISYRGEILETSNEVDNRMMTVNYLGQAALTKALLPKMIDNKNGHIVAVSSLQGRIAIPFRSSYAASKHAFQAFCDSLRAEVAHHNIRVSVISPGYIKTNLSLNAVTGDGSRYGMLDETTAKGMPPEDVAQQILSAIEENKSEVVLGSFAHVAVIYLRTLLPAFYFKIMNSRAKKQRKEINKDK